MYKMDTSIISYIFSGPLQAFYNHPGRRLKVAAVMACVCLVWGMVFLDMANLESISSALKQNIEVEAFLRKKVAEEQAADLIARFKSKSEVASCEFISSPAALQELMSDSETRDFVKTLGSNPLPSSLRITFKPETIDLECIERLAGELSALPEIESVEYDRQAVIRLFRIIDTVRMLILLPLCILAVLTLLVTIGFMRGLVFDSRAEQPLEQRSWLVRLKFLFEGIWLGFLGGLAAAWVIFVLERNLDRLGLNQMVSDLTSGRMNNLTALPGHYLFTIILIGIAGAGIAGWITGGNTVKE